MYHTIYKATCHYAIMHGENNWRWFHDMTNDMVGIIYLAQCNSRPGPWIHFNKTTLQKMLDEKLDYWIAIEGVKLCNKKGARACFMSEGCIHSACPCSNSHNTYPHSMDMWVPLHPPPKKNSMEIRFRFL